MALDKHTLLFDVRRSVRYHDRRVYFFERWHSVTSVLTILLSGSVLLQIAGDSFEPPFWLRLISFSAAILASIDMVISYSKMADLHKRLKRRYCELEICIVSAKSAKELDGCHSERLSIEIDEPPVYRALDLLCRNELMSAMGYETDEADYRELSLFKRLTCHLHTWPDIGRKIKRRP